jgi:hypothetical protein
MGLREIKKLLHGKRNGYPYRGRKSLPITYQMRTDNQNTKGDQKTNPPRINDPMKK